MPKIVQRFFVVSQSCDNLSNDENADEKTPENAEACVVVIDKRKSVNI